MRDTPCPMPDFEDHDAREHAQAMANIHGIPLAAWKRPGGSNFLSRSPHGRTPLVDAELTRLGYRPLGQFEPRHVDDLRFPLASPDGEGGDDGSAA